MSIEFDDIDLLAAKAEKLLNYPGYIPIVSTMSGALRLGAGKIMAVAGIILSLGFLIASTFNTKYMESAKRSFEYVIQGAANMIRGVIECIPLVNLTTIPYDMATRYTYPAELIQQKPTLTTGASLLQPILQQ